jgi:hypothetical protein
MQGSTVIEWRGTGEGEGVSMHFLKRGSSKRLHDPSAKEEYLWKIMDQSDARGARQNE